MGYACPVCEDPQADGEHLANHLAFTAMLGDDAHESWLDEHAPDWEGANPAELAERVTDHADEEEFPQVFEDTTDGTHDHGGHDHAHGDRQGTSPDAFDQFGDVEASMPDEEDVETEDVLAEAREMTRRRRENASEGEGADDPADGSDE